MPLFYAYHTIGKRRELPRAIAPWALDSGGFNELAKRGRWRMTAAEYIEGVTRLRDEVGMLDFACPMDWPCGPPVLAATGKDVEYHLRATVDNMVELLAEAPGLPWAPVIQGWDLEDYHRHIELYDDAGINLDRFDTVTVGSVAARQGDPIAVAIFRTIKTDYGLPIHGLGVKRSGLKQYADALQSADSMAWSFEARFTFGPKLDACAGKHDRCMDCLDWALAWNEEILRIIDDRERFAAGQMELFDPGDGFEPGKGPDHKVRVVDPISQSEQRKMNERRERLAELAALTDTKEANHED